MMIQLTVRLPVRIVRVVRRGRLHQQHVVSVGRIGLAIEPILILLLMVLACRRRRVRGTELRRQVDGIVGGGVRVRQIR